MPHQIAGLSNHDPLLPPSFGAWLKRQRKLHDLTQAELAQHVGCARVTIRKLEADEMRPSRQLAELLAQALDIPAAERAGWVLAARGVGPPEAALVSEARPKSNLPLQPTSFVGREREIAEVRRLLETTHLLTLTGSGGTGKTRLCLEAAAEAVGEYKDGVWLVELATIADAALMMPAVASVLGVRPEQNLPLQATLLEWLRAKRLLLILDNCEHLIEACAQFAQAVLHTSGGTRILATSREALGIGGETAYRVASLACPTPAEANAIRIEELAKYAGVRLFIERAMQSLTTFQVTSANASAVAQICSRLDGIPLAIELAAARIKAMSVEQITLRLDDRFRLLTGGSRTALPRQQTLRGTLDWSHSLLSWPERILLRRLSVFAGSWTLEAAERVCSLQSSVDSRPTTSDSHAADLPTDDVLDLLTRLVDKSLVVLDEHKAGARYRMLETVRQYAREKLLDADESESFRDKHLAYFLKLSEDAEPMLMRGRCTAWLPRLEAENDNLRAALEWACQRSPEAARWLAGLLRWYWFFADHMIEAPNWYERVLGLSDRGRATKGLALALLGAGQISAFLFSSDHAAGVLEQSAAYFRALGDNARLAESFALMVYAYLHSSRSEAGCAVLESRELGLRSGAIQRSELVRQFAEPLILALALTYWGRSLAIARHDYATAKALHEESLAVGRQCEEPAILGFTLQNLGHWAVQQADYEAACRYHLESLAWRRRLGTRWQIGIALQNVGTVKQLQGETAEAQPFFQEALELFQAMGDRVYGAYQLAGLGFVAIQRRALDQASTLLSESLAGFRTHGCPPPSVYCLLGFAEMWRVQGAVSRAVQLLAYLGSLPAIQQGSAPNHRILYDRSVPAMRAQLSESDFNAAWEAGRVLSLEEAITLTLSNE